MSEINLRYIKSILKYLIKSITEYKVNFYSSIVVEIMVLFMSLITFFLLKYNFKDISWTYRDFILFFLLGAMIIDFGELFLVKIRHINYIIKNGNLSKELILPKNNLLILFTRELNSVSFTMLIIDILSLIILLTLNIIIIRNWFFLICLMFIIVIFYIFLILFFVSFELRFIGVSKSLIYFMDSINYFIERFPPILFKNFKYKIFLYISIFFIVGVLLIPIAKNEITKKLIETIILFVFSTILIMILAIINWNHNLKYYDSFS